MSAQIQFIVNVEIEDDKVDTGDVDLLDIDLDGVPEGTEFLWSARRVE